jgi:hypothetical protein
MRIICCVLLVVVVCVAASLAAARMSPEQVEAELVALMRQSEALTVADVDALSEKELYKHLAWRGEACEDCNTKAKLQTVLRDLVEAKAPLSTKQYSDVTAEQHRRRSRSEADDNPRGNNKRRRARRMNEEKSNTGLGARDNHKREKLRTHPNDPLGSLKSVLHAHGLQMHMHDVQGEKDTHQFLQKAKSRTVSQPPPAPDVDLTGGDL